MGEAVETMASGDDILELVGIAVAEKLLWTIWWHIPLAVVRTGKEAVLFHNLLEAVRMVSQDLELRILMGHQSILDSVDFVGLKMEPKSERKERMSTPDTQIIRSRIPSAADLQHDDFDVVSMWFVCYQFIGFER
jgi:hypothetical protein